MKHTALFIALLAISAVAFGQDCKALLRPRFSDEYMQQMPADKLDYHCMFVRSAFYVSDTIPTGAQLYNITDVIEKNTQSPLPANFVVDLETFSYYGYNFIELQARYQGCNTVLCFATPSSAHPYLVLRSTCEMYALADQLWNAKYQPNNAR